MFLDLSEAKKTRLFPEPPPAPKPAKRTLSAASVPGSMLSGLSGNYGFAGAKYNRLTEDFLAAQRSADQDLFGDNIRLRARARKLAVDNPFARKFLAMVVQNVTGPAGILMQAKVKNEHGKATEQTKRINQRIEEEWKNWCEVGSCSADGRFSFAELQQLAIKNVAREGENLVKLAYDRSFNPTGFALQPLDNDQLDDTLMRRESDTVQVRLGVEVNQYQRPTAYHLWASHPFEAAGLGTRLRSRIPAADVIHSFVSERPVQTRGYTWMSAAILPLHHYERYDEATVVAARASAAKFGVIQREAAEGYTEDEDEDVNGEQSSDTNGAGLMNASPGEMMTLGPGETLNYIDPKFPTQTYRDFTRTTLRNIASGLLVSYPSLANDLEGVNFSSIRAGLLDERDSWRIIQRWFIDHFLKPVFDAWLRMALLTTLQDIELSPRQKRQVAWRARGWPWVDPLKDAQSTILDLQNGLDTYENTLAEMGLDFEEVMTQRASEQKFIEDLKLRLGTDIRGIADSASDVAGGTDGSGAAAQQDEQKGKSGGGQ